MKANTIMKKLLLLLFSGQIISAYAQQSVKPCGPYIIDSVALKKILKYEHENISAPAGTILIRVYFHDCAYSDGSNITATPAQIYAEFNVLVSVYTSDNICFLFAGVDQINSTSVDTTLNGTNPSSILTALTSYEIPDCINIFYTGKIQGSNGACSGNCGYGGITPALPGTVCLVAKSNIGQGQTVAHEVGHCMGLLHTFEPANGYEDIDGTNSSTSADLITDTPADPYAYNAQSCFSHSGCVYNGNCTDPKNQTNFSPPYTNLMSYWWAYGGCGTPLIVTNGQYTRVNSTLSSVTALMNCESPSSITESGISISSGYLMTSAVNSFTTSGTISISGTANVTFGGSPVLLEPGFDALPSGGGLTFIAPAYCTGNFTGKSVVNPSAAENEINQPATGFFAYPNPASSSVNLTFNLTNNEPKAAIEIYDMSLRLVKEVPLGNLIKGNHTITLQLGYLSSGIYSVVLRLPEKIMRTTLMIAK